MLFRSFPAYSHVFALILSSLLFLSLPHAASCTQNVTFRFNSSQVAFTTGWRLAEFAASGSVDEFAFANSPGEEVIIQVPQNVTALSYRGFRIRGGAQYFVCLDCSDTVPSVALSVDAHDDADNGTQPPDTLFALSVDPTQTHVLRVINLEDDRFNGASQITFDSLVLTLNDGDDHEISPSVSPSLSPSTTSPGATSTTPSGGNPTVTVPVSGTDGRTVSTVPSSVGSSSPGVSGTAASLSNSGSGASPTLTSSSLVPTSTGSQTQTGSNTTGSTISSGGSQPATPTSASSDSGSGSSSTASARSEQTSGAGSSNLPSNGGISKTVIIVVAVIASIFVLALLAAITWLLIRNQPAPRGDVEGTPGPMREAAPAAFTVSNPLPLSPMRPEIPNPFVDPLDDLDLPPRPAPAPPLPPRSPLRVNFPSDRPAWLTRTPRTSSPESNE